MLAMVLTSLIKASVAWIGLLTVNAESADKLEVVVISWSCVRFPLACPHRAVLVCKKLCYRDWIKSGFSSSKRGRHPRNVTSLKLWYLEVLAIVYTLPVTSVGIKTSVDFSLQNTLVVVCSNKNWRKNLSTNLSARMKEGRELLIPKYHITCQCVLTVFHRHSAED